MRPALRSMSIIAVLAALLVRTAAATPVVKTVTIHSKTKAADISVQVTQIQHPTAAQQAFNRRQMEAAQKSVAAFKKQVAADHPTAEQAWEYTSRVKTCLLTAHWYSFLDMGSVFTGGAHPNPLYGSTLLDLSSGRELTLADLFRPGTPYLKTIADLCKKEIATRDLGSDKEWQNRGMEPKADNFSVFYVDGKNLVILFPPYQVGPYSAGPQEVKIPYATLKSMAQPGRPLGP